jgi:hypothetical protein
MPEDWPQGLQIGFPKIDGIFSFLFFCLGANTRPKVVQHLLVTWGSRVKKKNSILAFTTNVKKALGVDFNFCTNRNA